MANTTNYNWETPDDTDLVKDGAAAIRTLGNSVDTTTKALNPETTLGDIAYRSATSNTNTRLAIGSAGQVLTVAAGVPSWASPSDQTPLTTKGDVFTFSTVDARLGVGANGTVLTADSAETTGLKWAAPASWTLDSTTTLSGASTSINLSAGYKAFHIYCVNYQFTNDAYGYVRFNSNTGSVYRWYGLSLTGTTANAAYYANSDTAFFLSNAQPAESGNQNNHFYMQLYNMDSTTAHKQFLISDKSLSNGAEKRIANAGGFFESTTAITTIQIFTNDTWSGGTVLVYGVK
jgi:hypothetical protein